MLVAIVGATGNLGRALVTGARARGLGVRAISRDIDRDAFEPDVDCVKASAADQDALTAALESANVVVIAFPPSLAAPGDYPDQIRNVFAAARASGARGVVGLIGSAGALTPHGQRLYETDYFEETTRHFYASVSNTWDAYRGQLEPDWVAFVPAARMQTHLADRSVYRTRIDEQLVTTDDASWRYFDTSQISYGDMAMAMLDEIERPSHSRQFVTVAY